MATGDIIAGQGAPLIHREKNGSSEGWDYHNQRNRRSERRRVCAGPRSYTDEGRYPTEAERHRSQEEKIKELFAQGKSLDEIRAAVGDPPPNP